MAIASSFVAYFVVCFCSLFNGVVAGSGPSPISFTPDENWDGIDGPWNTFTVQIGTPPQYVRLLPSTESQQTWAVLPLGCEYTNGTVDGYCVGQRGGDFDPSASTTWDATGNFTLWIEQDWGLEGSGAFGYDVLALGGNGDNLPSLQNVSLGGVSTLDFYIGVFGLSPKPTNFTNFSDPTPSLMTRLKEENYIPSLSFGYTAGAQYRFSAVLSSLTLGGYDSNRFIANDLSIPFAADNEHSTTVAIQSIQLSNEGSTQLLPEPIYSLIDSTLAELWLPVSACQAFEQAFGIVYDNTTDLYLINSTQHEQLVAQNNSVTFTLGSQTQGGDTIEITFPYAAFDLTAFPPYQGLSEKASYFPLRRAQNSSQYLLGRTFLQEAYLTVDYERQNFSIAQVNWTQNAPTNIVAIAGVNVTGNGTTSAAQTPTHHGLATGAIAGIAVAAALIALLAATALFFFLRYRRLKRRAASAQRAGAKRLESGTSSDAHSLRDLSTPASPTTADGAGDAIAAAGGTTVYPKAELDAAAPAPAAPFPQDEKDAALAITQLHNGITPSSPAQGPVTPGTGSWSNNVMSPISPAFPTGSGFFPFGAAQGPVVYEMEGTTPTKAEMDAPAVGEKDACRMREAIYNGRDTAPEAVLTTLEREQRARMVDGSQVELVGRHKVGVSGSPTTGKFGSGSAGLTTGESASSGASVPRTPRTPRVVDGSEWSEQEGGTWQSLGTDETRTTRGDE